MNIDTELQDYEAAGSLAEELPYWGWLDDERTCLTRAGELDEPWPAFRLASWTARRHGAAGSGD